jgi:DNA-binding LytR/AlgR family response regulator
MVSDQWLMVRVQEGVYVLNPSEILYLEASSNYTKIYSRGNKMILSAATLKKYERRLKDFEFIRIHQTYLINKRHITGVDDKKNIQLGNHILLQASKRKWKALQQQISLVPAPGRDGTQTVNSSAACAPSLVLNL